MPLAQNLDGGKGRILYKNGDYKSITEVPGIA